MPPPGGPTARSAVRHLALAGALALTLAVGACGDTQDDPVRIGLITKQEENPFWVTVREVAQDVSGDQDVELLTATGRTDVDVESQVQALQEMTESGVDGILIAPNDSEAVVPAIEAAREAGVIVIAIDTPTEPESAVDALFATDNELAGTLIGQYARARADADGMDARIALLDLAPGIRSGELRRAGFLEGFGIEEGDPRISGSFDSEGDEDRGRQGMQQLLSQDPDINVVYAVNEPAAFGAVTALREAGKSLDEVVVVTVDGGCQAIRRGVRSGDINATAQQYPQNMAREGVLALAEAVRGGERPSGYLDTGVVLITGDEVSGVESRGVPFGTRNCWGS